MSNKHPPQRPPHKPLATNHDPLPTAADADHAAGQEPQQPDHDPHAQSSAVHQGPRPSRLGATLHLRPSLIGEQREVVEPAEVLGRHRNSGQKDHKGAR